jgi:hypothetical protein
MVGRKYISISIVSPAPITGKPLAAVVAVSWTVSGKANFRGFEEWSLREYGGSPSAMTVADPPITESNNPTVVVRYR